MRRRMTTSQKPDTDNNIPVLIAPRGDEYGLPVLRVTQPDPPNGTPGAWWQPSTANPRINPSEGGEPREGNALGWTDGFLRLRSRKAAFTGRVIVLRGTRTPPVVGNVGRDNRLARLAAGHAALTNDFTPSVNSIAASFYGASPLQMEMARQTEAWSDNG